LVSKAGFYHCACADIKELLFGKSLKSIGYTGWGGIRPSAVVVELLAVDQYMLSCSFYWGTNLLSCFQHGEVGC
jgi:hypothetical protein